MNFIGKNMRKKLKTVFSMLLTFSMVMSMLSPAAFATEKTGKHEHGEKGFCSDGYYYTGECEEVQIEVASDGNAASSSDASSDARTMWECTKSPWYKINVKMTDASGEEQTVLVRVVAESAIYDETAEGYVFTAQMDGDSEPFWLIVDEEDAGKIIELGDDSEAGSRTSLTVTYLSSLELFNNSNASVSITTIRNNKEFELVVKNLAQFTLDVDISEMPTVNAHFEVSVQEQPSGTVIYQTKQDGSRESFPGNISIYASDPIQSVTYSSLNSGTLKIKLLVKQGDKLALDITETNTGAAVKAYRESILPLGTKFKDEFYDGGGESLGDAKNFSIFALNYQAGAHTNCNFAVGTFSGNGGSNGSTEFEEDDVYFHNALGYGESNRLYYIGNIKGDPNPNFGGTSKTDGTGANYYLIMGLGHTFSWTDDDRLTVKKNGTQVASADKEAFIEAFSVDSVDYEINFGKAFESYAKYAEALKKCSPTIKLEDLPRKGNDVNITIGAGSDLGAGTHVLNLTVAELTEQNNKFVFSFTDETSNLIINVTGTDEYLKKGIHLGGQIIDVDQAGKINGGRIMINFGDFGGEISYASTAGVVLAPVTEEEVCIAGCLYGAVIAKSVKNSNEIHWVPVPDFKVPGASDTEQEMGQLTVKKTIRLVDENGTATDEQIPQILQNKEFEFVVTGPNSYEETVTLKHGDEKTLTGLVPGNYCVRETTDGREISNYSFVRVDGEKTEDNPVVLAEIPAKVEITNVYKNAPQQSGEVKLYIKKVIEGINGTEIPESGKTFTFVIKPDSADEQTEGKEVSITIPAGSMEATSDAVELTPGRYTISEKVSEDMMKIGSYKFREFQVVDGDNYTFEIETDKTITVKNLYGQEQEDSEGEIVLKVEKIINGAVLETPKVFTFSLTGKAKDGTEINKVVSVEIQAGQTSGYSSIPLPVGEYQVTENTEDAGIQDYKFLEVSCANEGIIILTQDMANKDVSYQVTNCYEPEKPEEPTKEPENPTDPSPENPTDPSPENPTDPSPENPTDPSPENPTDPSPENPTTPSTPDSSDDDDDDYEYYDEDDDDYDDSDGTVTTAGDSDPGAPSGLVQVDIEEEPVPLAASAPETPEKPQEVVISENPVPLSAVPETGDAQTPWLALMAVSATGLAGLSLTGRRKKEENED